MEDIDKRRSWCHAALVLAKKIPSGSVKANQILRDMLVEFGTLENIYDHFFGMLPIDPAISKSLDKAYAKAEFDFQTISISDQLYPECLKKTDRAAPVIYCRGNQGLLRLTKTVAFVGTRELNNPEHQKHGDEVIERLLKAGYEAIVSGLALGSDTLGHLSAIRHGGKTIAVLGTPLDMYYPKENKELQDEIAKNHLLISEYPIGLRSFGSYFANRNRTTVGLSTEGVIVARAGDKSGTQYAMRHCMDEGKQLYILENNIHEPYEWISKYRDKFKVIRK